LNEAFATWIEQKLIAEWKPEWKTRVEDVDSKLYAEGEDSLVSVRKIRQEIKTKDDISNAFDGITYQKGAAVIGMFENYIGPAEFRKGVQSYLKEYAFRNATAPEFLDAISTASKKNVTKAFSTFRIRPVCQSFSPRWIAARILPSCTWIRIALCPWELRTITRKLGRSRFVSVTHRKVALKNLVR
jgi:hypothetical protein